MAGLRVINEKRVQVRSVRGQVEVISSIKWFTACTLTVVHFPYVIQFNESTGGNSPCNKNQRLLWNIRNGVRDRRQQGWKKKQEHVKSRSRNRIIQTQLQLTT